MKSTNSLIKKGIRLNIIAPMLYIPFVENAFKHSTLKQPGNSIIFKLDVLENQIIFSCINSLSFSPSEKDESSGIGLGNNKKMA